MCNIVLMCCTVTDVYHCFDLLYCYRCVSFFDLLLQMCIIDDQLASHVLRGFMHLSNVKFCFSMPSYSWLSLPFSPGSEVSLTTFF